MPLQNTVSVGTTPTLIIAEGERKAVIVSNLSAGTVFLSVSGDATVSTTKGHPLTQNAKYIASRDDRRSIVTNQAIYGIVASGTSNVVVETIP